MGRADPEPRGRRLGGPRHRHLVLDRGPDARGTAVNGLQLLADDLDREIPGLMANAAVVALVPATELRGWAAEMAWRIARAAAAGGRRTVLVDCMVDSPTLHGAEEGPHQEG